LEKNTGEGREVNRTKTYIKITTLPVEFSTGVILTLFIKKLSDKIEAGDMGRVCKTYETD
jgi:hypothetical protein